jgi:AcrR family transcriptional regulator
MAKRGTQLREHILLTAKDVFLEMGFERASMDEVARRAETSKRTLYAYFESKENLFLAILDLVGALLLSRLGTPQQYSDKPEEALALFCSRYLETLLYESAVRMLRLTNAETEQFPQAASRHFAAMFGEIEHRVATYIAAAFNIPSRVAADAAERLFAQLLYPRLLRALFGLESLEAALEPDAATPRFDIRRIRKLVADMIQSLPRERAAARR